MVVLQSAKLAGMGVAIGVAVALPLTSLLESQVFGITALDPLTVGAVPLLLLTTAIIASLVPAIRAMTVDPLAALRDT